jgi:adenosylcobinamide-GDP ribazoletransferase
MLQAVRFLTIVPAGDESSTGRSVVLFPVVGAVLGWIGARSLGLLTPWLGNALAVLLVLALWCILTGARHEIGLLRCLGQLGTVALVFLTIVRWQAIMRLPSAPVMEFVAALAISRAALVAIAWLSRPVGDGIHLGTHMNSVGAVLAMAGGIAFAVAAGRQGMVMMVAAGLVTLLLVQWFDENRGGIDGHGLRASSLFIETIGLVIMSCRNCFW